MKSPTKILLGLAMIAALTAGSARADLLLNVVISGKALVQEDTTDSGDSYLTPNPSSVKVDNKAILQRVAEVKGTTYPAGAKLALSTDTGGFLVVGKTNNVIDDISAYLTFDPGDDDSGVYADRGNYATGQDSTKSWFIGKLVYDDGGIRFELRGLVTATQTSAARKTDGSQAVAITGGLKNGAGDGHADGGDVNLIVTGNMNVTGKGTVIDL